jgi:hypothetical protein
MQGGRNLFTFFIFYFWVIVYFSSILYSTTEILDFKWPRSNYGEGPKNLEKLSLWPKAGSRRSFDTTVVNQANSPGKYPM